VSDDHVTSASSPAQISFELASRNTGLAFQRTRMAADRTLMAVIRTSLSLISFGFTIFQIFQKFKGSNMLIENDASTPHFGVMLVGIGITMLILGIAYHLQFMFALRITRRNMAADGLIRGKSPFPPSLTLITAVILLAIGIAAIISMVFRVVLF
jgi:putative membrane protein